MQGAMAELQRLLVVRQGLTSRQTAFGYGFERWVWSMDLLKHLNSLSQHQFTFKEVREMYKELANRKLIEIKQSRTNGMLAYSTIGWEDCKPIGDYFIELNEDINPNSIEAQGLQPY
jgi:hypothetical protein